MIYSIMEYLVKTVYLYYKFIIFVMPSVEYYWYSC